MMDHLCIEHGNTHASDEPLRLLDLLAIYWLPKMISIPFVSKRSLKRQAGRELGLITSDKSTDRQKQKFYTKIVQASCIFLFPIAIFVGIGNRIIDRMDSR